MSFRNYYDSSTYGRSRDTSRGTAVADRPTTVTAKYLNTASTYKTSSIPILSRSHSATRDESSITAIANRYSNYSKSNRDEKAISKYDKKDYAKLSLSTASNNRSRDVSPASTSSKYSIRSSRYVSPERKTKSSLKNRSPEPSSIDRDKDIPCKTDKSTSYNSLSSYKHYPRTSSYIRPSSRAEIKPEITVNRYAIANRLSSSYLRSSPVEKSRTSISPVKVADAPKLDTKTPSVSPIIKIEDENNSIVEIKTSEEENENEMETITVITRHTSPTPPGSSAYVRTRRADMARTVEKSVTRTKQRPHMVDKEIQSDRLDDSTRTCRFGSTARPNVPGWSVYTPSSNSYTGYAGRYSTQYSSLRENSALGCNERSSRSRSTEPIPKEETCTTVVNKNKDEENNIDASNNVTEMNPEIVTVYENNKEDDTSEIIINVNFKLKKAKTPSTAVSKELVSPEITITNSQLPPQAPKAEGSTKVKKIKTRKSSADSSSDSSSSPKKKVVKKRCKSVSSSDSDQTNESKDKATNNGTISSPKSISKKSSKNLNSKHSKSRESNSPESSITLSTQSSISEDDTISKSKTNDISRTSADEISFPTDKSGKQSSPSAPQKCEGSEDAKSFLIRALAPVTNLFKNKQDSNDARWLESSVSESTGKDVSNLVTESDRSNKSKSNTADIVASIDDNVVKLKSIRHIESGERAWWLDSDSEKKNNSSCEKPVTTSDKNTPRKIRHIESGERAWWLENNSTTDNKSDNISKQNESSDKFPKKSKYSDEENPWWLDSNANVPEGVERLSPPRKTSNDSEKSDKYDFFKVRHVESGDQKDWWLTNSENSASNKHDVQNNLSKSGSDPRSFPVRRIKHVDSGEKPWWLSSSKNIPEGIEKLPTPPPQAESESSDSEELQVYTPLSLPMQPVPPFPLSLPDDEPLGDRRSPEGLETPRDEERYRDRMSPYENNRQYRRKSSTAIDYQKAKKYISRYTDIDDILGTSSQIYSPFMDSILARRTRQLPYDDSSECEEIDSTQVKIHDSTPQRPVIKKLRSRSEIIDCRGDAQLDDVALQVFKDGEYGSYLDLDSTLGEQEEELEGLQNSRKNGIILRTQLSVRVHALIERLLQSQGRELRRALFSLKQVLQSDDDLVHEFVANKGLDCLMQLGSRAEDNYLDYILRALGQILMYVDGMHGVMAHSRCIQWLYSLVGSQFRHVVKTTLKLLLVFVEYTEKNCLLLIEAIKAVDTANNKQPWNLIMEILQDVDASDTELLIYATSLINKCLNNIRDGNLYYDQVDALQDQGIDDIIQLYMSKQGTDLDLLRQLQIFEAVLLYADGDETGTALRQLDDSIIKSIRRRNTSHSEKRKSKHNRQQQREKENTTSISRLEVESKNTHKPPTYLPSIKANKENKELTTALRRRRDRYERQAHHITQQQELMNCKAFCNESSRNSDESLDDSNNDTHTTAFECENYSDVDQTSFSEFQSCMNIYNGVNDNNITDNGNPNSLNEICRIFTSNPIKNNRENDASLHNGNLSKTSKNYVGLVNNYPSYKKLNSFQNSHQEEEKKIKKLNNADNITNGNQRNMYTSGLIQRMQNGTLGHTVNALDTLTVIRQKQMDNVQDTKDDRIVITKANNIKDLAQRLTSPEACELKPPRVAETTGIVSKAKEELAKQQTKEIVKSPTIEIVAPKFNEIKISENDIHWEELRKGCLHREYHLCDLDFSDLKNDSDNEVCPAVHSTGTPPPPPPGMFPLVGAPPPPPVPFSTFSVPQTNYQATEVSNDSDSLTIKKNKKTVKLFWKEIQENQVTETLRNKIGGFFWDNLPNVNLDTKMLEHLFESRSNDLIIKEKITEPKRNLILDAKRSNAINIAMKKLPTPQTIKAAIMKMDATVIGREGIEKLLTMLPTDEEKLKIQEAQYANPDLPLGSAEQFLLTLASVSELSSRLKLWVFKLDFDNSEKEIAEPLMDLKQGIELLKENKTFKAILATLRTVGSFLNGSQVKGFRLEYLSKVMEVKDTVHKHPLLYHVCEMVIDKFPDSSDLFSEVGPVIRASKVDFDILSANLARLEADCKASWDHKNRVAKHDGSQISKTKINEFLTDAAERIILLNIIKKRVMNRYNKFLMFMGVPPQELDKTKPSNFLKVIAEFALEFRTSRERVLQQLEKRANHRERTKTRGKMITDTGNYSAKNGDRSADSALKELLRSEPYSDSMSEPRRRPAAPVMRLAINGDLSSDNEIIKSLVRSAASRRRPGARDRKKPVDRKKYSSMNGSPDRQQVFSSREDISGSGAQQR